MCDCRRSERGSRRASYFGGAGVNTSRLWPGSGLGFGLGAFFCSFLPLSLLPMGDSMTQNATLRKAPLRLNLPRGVSLVAVFRYGRASRVIVIQSRLETSSTPGQLLLPSTARRRDKHPLRCVDLRCRTANLQVQGFHGGLILQTTVDAQPVLVLQAPA